MEDLKISALESLCAAIPRLADALTPYPQWSNVEAICKCTGLTPKSVGRHATYARNHVVVSGGNDGTTEASTPPPPLTPSFFYFVMNKPRGCVVARPTCGETTGGTVYDRLDSAHWPHVPHVGRLDADSEGLLLFSDDGRLAHALLDGSAATASSVHVPKVYRVKVRGVRWTDAGPDAEGTEEWARGATLRSGDGGDGDVAWGGDVPLDELRAAGSAHAQLLALTHPLIYCSGQGATRGESGRTRPAGVRVLYRATLDARREDAAEAEEGDLMLDAEKKGQSGARNWVQRTSAVLEFTLTDGKNRQIRRLCRRSGLTVASLTRVTMVPRVLDLGDLQPGECRALTTADVAECYAAAGLEAAEEWGGNLPLAIQLPFVKPENPEPVNQSYQDAEEAAAAGAGKKPKWGPHLTVEDVAALIVRNGSVEAVETLLRVGIDPNTVDADGAVFSRRAKAPLVYLAFYHNRVEAGHALLKAGADINSRCAHDGITCLYNAVQHGKVEMVKVILAAGADVDQERLLNSCTPLFCASDEGFDEIVDLLLAGGADVERSQHNTKSARYIHSEGCTPLFIAAQVGRDTIVDKLIAAGANVNHARTDGTAPLAEAAKKGHAVVVEKLLAAGAGVKTAETTDGNTALHCAAEGGHVPVIELLLRAGADVDDAAENGSTPLSIAAANGHTEACVALLEAGADLETTMVEKQLDGATPMFLAAYNGHIPCLKKLIEAGAVVDHLLHSNGATALYKAAFKGQPEVVETLIAAGADINIATTPDGITPLYFSSGLGHVAIVEMLIAAGADLNKARTDTGESPLYISSQKGQLEGNIKIVEMLIKAGADVDQVGTQHGATPLYVASQNGHTEVVRHLLAGNANANITRFMAKGQTHADARQEQIDYLARIGNSSSARGTSRKKKKVQKESRAERKARLKIALEEEVIECALCGDSHLPSYFCKPQREERARLEKAMMAK